MDSRYKERFDVAPHHQQTLKLCSRTESSSTICEDQKITTRLASARMKDCGSTEREDLSSAIHDSARMDDNRVGEIKLDRVRKTDQILIETARSVYVFTIKDPRALSGRLIGGLLGNRLVEAYLLPSRSESHDSRGDQKSVKTGEKLTFIFDAGSGPQRLTTSAITALVHRTKPRAAHLLKGRRRVTLEQVSD